MESLNNGQLILDSDSVDKILTGERVKIWPWARGFYARDMLYWLWRMMEGERMTDVVFYKKTTLMAPPPISTHMDLVEFIQFFTLSSGSRLLLIPRVKDTEEVIGFSWYDDVVLGDSASASMFYRKKFWGEVAQEATLLGLRYGFEILKLQKVWGYSPWKASVAHRGRVGFREIAEVPEAITDTQGKTRTLYIACLKKETFYGNG